ncbi:MAG: ABC transporter permease, partial [Verrucomicrobiaceae bacterium]
MNLWLGLLIGLKEIWAHKFRSFLTMLGVILGVASLLSMFALTAGMAKGMREYMQQVGGIERVDIDTQDLPEHQQALADLSPGRTVADAEAIKKNVPGVAAVTPISTLGNAAITQGANTFRYPVSGCWPDYVEINKHVVEHGRNLCFLDIDEAKRVCVIGRLAVERLWPDKTDIDPVGKTISINDRPFTVVGVFEYYEREEDKRRRELGLKPEFGRNRGGRARGPFDRKNSTIIVPISTMFFDFK